MIIGSFGDNKEVEDDGFNVIEADSSVSSEDADAHAHANDMSPVYSIDKNRDSIVTPSFSNLSDGIIQMRMHLLNLMTMYTGYISKERHIDEDTYTGESKR